MKIGVLGLGSIGVRHARNLRDLDCEVIGFDPRHVGNPFFTTARDRESVIFADADALVIASPTSEHYRDLLDCIAAGKPTFVEKPIAATHQEWRSLRNHSTKKLFVGNNLRFRACVKMAVTWLPKIGRPIWASFTLAQHSAKPDYLRDGVTLNWGAHEIDLALHLLGPAEVRSASVSDQDDLADLTLTHESGCRTSIHLDYLTNPEVRRSLIVGTDGQIEMDIRRNSARLQLAGLSFELTEQPQSFDQDYVEEMRAFLDRIAGKETLGATGEDGLAALNICLAAKAIAGQP